MSITLMSKSSECQSSECQSSAPSALQNAFFSNAPYEWNLFDRDVRSSKSNAEFKRMKSFPNNYVQVETSNGNRHSFFS